jgi:uncharacterized membrane protein
MICAVSPTAPTRIRRRSRLTLAALMTGAGVMHFVKPRFYESMVPSWIGHETAVVAASGVAEIAAGALLVSERTRRVGAWSTVAILVGVYPANIQMALDATPPESSEDWAAWIRLPFQIPMLVWALRHTR